MGVKSILAKLSIRHRNNKALYYVLNFIRQIIPNAFYRLQLSRKLSATKSVDKRYIAFRVNYYNKLRKIALLPDTTARLADFKLSRKHKTYFFDTFEYTRYFPGQIKLAYAFGDMYTIPSVPSIVKSRPVSGDNENAVLLKLNKIRHFTFTNDRRRFETKRNLLIGRMNARQALRLRFLEMYFSHPMCNVGQVNKKDGNPKYLKEYISIDGHLDYKFILCLEGYDVASNLKWVMSSGSIAVMCRPKFETWFMEGTLIPGYHYIEIKEDFSDVEEKLNYYIENTDKAKGIVRHANEYVAQFRNQKREDLISLLVLEKYCYMTGQKEPPLNRME